MSIQNCMIYPGIPAFISEDDMVDAVVVEAADEDPEAVVVHEVPVEDATREIEVEDSTALPVLARAIAATNGPEAVAVAWAELAMEAVNRSLKTILGAELLVVAPVAITRTIADTAEAATDNKTAINLERTVK